MTSRTSNGPTAAHPGIALVEMLFVIMLLGVFAVIATSIFRTSMNVLHRFQVDDNALRGVDSALSRLRGDVWSASQLSAENGVLTIQQSEGSVRWTMKDDWLVRSTTVDGRERTQRWPVAPLALGWEVDAAGVLVQVIDQRRSTTSPIRLVSQVLQLEGGGS